MTHSSPVNAEADDLATLREVEVEWLSSELSRAISNLAYPVGMGIPPHETHIKSAADALFERYAKMIEMARRTGIRAQSTPEPVTYQLRFRRESGEWSEWQNVVSPWDGSRNPAWEYRPLYAAFSSPGCKS